ncbi:hypothetical protein BEP19_12870 [Ammoniphilus oxalaticus]|uniref:Glycosyltransferase 2-like domain-containing protein n=1 Tax=Ammoniphilus oxalaticus TaxID=66863 RepID=A0A419SHI1_9BACL|nr:hypothetical protein BEP19_12870 [Ammoniphilus oxalaticus]
MKNPKVSICCITFNHESYIENAIKSFLMQETDFPFEILIHDDASTDGTQDIIRKYEMMYPKIIKPIYQTENQFSKGIRMIFTYNYSRALGEYIALCEGDDYWTDRKKIQKQVRILEENNGITLCIHSTGVFSLPKNSLDSNEIRLKNGDEIYNASQVILGGGMFGHTSSFVFRRKVIENLPEWFFDSPSGDTPLRLLSASLGDVYYIDQEMSVYRKGIGGSWTSRMQENKIFITHWEKSIKMYEEYNEYTDYRYSQAIKKRISQISYTLILRFISHMNAKKQLKGFYSRLVVIDKLKLKIKVLLLSISDIKKEY